MPKREGALLRLYLPSDRPLAPRLLAEIELNKVYGTGEERAELRKADYETRTRNSGWRISVFR